nr:MFS transporter [Mesorhizobium sp. M1E.F.Ca.ET.063.01.1.1]
MSDAVRIYHGRTPALPPGALTRFLVSTISAAVGRNGFYMASAWILVATRHGSAGVATLLATISLVELVSSRLIGEAADRLDRRRLNIAADLIRSALMLATACAILHQDALLTICLSAGLFAFFDRLALTASQAIIPIVARDRDLAVSNSTVFFVMQCGCLGAALLAGPLLAGHSPAVVFSILAVFFLVSAGSLYSMRLGAAPSGVREAESFSLNAEPGLFCLFVVYALLYGGAVLVSVMGSSFVFEELKGSAVDFGHVEAAWSAGSLIGPILLVGLTRTIPAHTLHLVLLGSTALALMALMNLRAPWTLGIFVALGLLYNMGRVSIEVTLQSRVSGNKLGRSKGAMHSLAVALGLLIFAIASFLGDAIPPSTVLFGFGVTLLISVLALSIGAAKQKDDA